MPVFAENQTMLIVFNTVPNPEEGETLARVMVEARLAACVQILPQMRSVYIWEGNVQFENEHLLLIKTTEEKYAELERFIIENHSYEVPEIVAVNAEQVAEPYLRWLDENLVGTDS
jgi:periplasmic divalent cation tolerance protein